MVYVNRVNKNAQNVFRNRRRPRVQKCSKLFSAAVAVRASTAARAAAAAATAADGGEAAVGGSGGGPQPPPSQKYRF